MERITQARVDTGRLFRWARGQHEDAGGNPHNEKERRRTHYRVNLFATGHELTQKHSVVL